MHNHIQCARTTRQVAWDAEPKALAHMRQHVVHRARDSVERYAGCEVCCE